MAGKLHAIILSTALAFSAQVARTQEAPPNPPQDVPAGENPNRPPQPQANKRGTPDRPILEQLKARRLLEQLPPEERQRIKQNLQQWKDMTPEERETMRLLEQQRRQKMQKETEDAINESGLKLDPDRREVYALRYAQERRKLEEKLRREIEEKRKAMIEEIIKALKAEFEKAPTASPTPTASQ